MYVKTFQNYLLSAAYITDVRTPVATFTIIRSKQFNLKDAYKLSHSLAC
jgi:hypothetical protein